MRSSRRASSASPATSTLPGATAPSRPRASAKRSSAEGVAATRSALSPSNAGPILSRSPATAMRIASGVFLNSSVSARPSRGRSDARVSGSRSITRSSAASSARPSRPSTGSGRRGADWTVACGHAAILPGRLHKRPRRGRRRHGMRSARSIGARATAADCDVHRPRMRSRARYADTRARPSAIATRGA